MHRLLNPIIPGYYPDPSICRVNDDFYIACSSFEMYPGIPIFHSRDLVHWEQLGNAMTAENGFHVERNGGVGGVMAPTLRYRDGVFYLIHANFSGRGNCIVTAGDPAGPWSRPHWMDDVPGIDASLFFDDDGQAYVLGTGDVWDNGAGVMERGIWLAKYDLARFKMAGEPVTIFNSALRGGAWPEAPHLYHVGDYYYLIIAEGGTEHYHAVMAARSREICGFYEGCPANPVMTHRHMGFACAVTNVGHADFVELKDGSWYAVMLASRLIGGKHKNLGRETFICPVVWERGWPLLSPETGKIEPAYHAPLSLLPAVTPAEPQRDDFDRDALPPYMVFWGTPGDGFWAIEDSCLKMRCIRQTLDAEIVPMAMDEGMHDDRYAAFAARRQRAENVVVTAAMRFWPSGGESAGIAAVQAMNHQLHIERARENGRQVVRAVLVTAAYNKPPFLAGFRCKTSRRVLMSASWERPDIILQLEMRGEDFTIRYGENENSLNELGKADGSLINPEAVGCMCGTLVGMYASGNGMDCDAVAAFDWFCCRESR